jgi:hypothetical protein
MGPRVGLGGVAGDCNYWDVKKKNAEKYRILLQNFIKGNKFQFQQIDLKEGISKHG